MPLPSRRGHGSFRRRIARCASRFGAGWHSPRARGQSARFRLPATQSCRKSTGDSGALRAGRSCKAPHVVEQIAAAAAVVAVAGAVFVMQIGSCSSRYIFFGALCNAGRIDLPTRVVDGRVFAHAVCQAGDSGTRVIVDGVKVTVTACRQVPERKAEAPCRHSERQAALEKPCRQRRRRAVQQVARVLRCEYAQTVANATRVSSNPSSRRTRWMHV